MKDISELGSKSEWEVEKPQPGEKAIPVNVPKTLSGSMRWQGSIGSGNNILAFWCEKYMTNDKGMIILYRVLLDTSDSKMERRTYYPTVFVWQHPVLIMPYEEEERKPEGKKENKNAKME